VTRRGGDLRTDGEMGRAEEQDEKMRIHIEDNEIRTSGDQEIRKNKEKTRGETLT